VALGRRNDQVAAKSALWWTVAGQPVVWLTNKGSRCRRRFCLNVRCGPLREAHERREFSRHTVSGICKYSTLMEEGPAKQRARYASHFSCGSPRES
jgi:hypothetical protein